MRRWFLLPTALSALACFNETGVESMTVTGESTASESGQGSTSSSTSETSTSAPDTSSSGPQDSGSSESTTTEGGDCIDLLWVIGDTDIASTRDAAFYVAVTQQGYDAELVQSAAATADMATGKCAVLLSAIGNSADINTKFRDVTTPVIVWDHSLFDDMGMVGAGASDSGTVAADSIEILLPEHPLAAGLAGTVMIQGAVDQLGWGNAGGEVIATVAAMPTMATIFTYAQGEAMPGLAAAPGIRVALPFASESMAVLDDSAVTLFVAAVDFATM